MKIGSNQRRRTTQAARPTITATTVSMRMAHRHRFAHLSSTSRSLAMISLRSSSVFSGIHAGTELAVLVGGSRKGDMRIKAPNIQNGGNTVIVIRMNSGVEERKHTESKFEKVHRERYWLWRVKSVFW